MTANSRTSRLGRGCSRAGCRQLASATLTYIYAEQTAVLGPLATYAEPHAYDLCAAHSQALRVPVGWQVSRPEISEEFFGPSEDDLMAIADAVREVGVSAQNHIRPLAVNELPEVGRRGHLRSVPNS